VRQKETDIFLSSVVSMKVSDKIFRYAYYHVYPTQLNFCAQFNLSCWICHD
jgi:hypothetical protein